MSQDKQKPEVPEEDDELIYLEDEDGTEVAFEFLDSITFREKEYIILSPVDEEDDGIVILEVEPPETEGGEETFYGVEDQTVLDGVYRIFRERFRDVIDFGD